MNIHLTLRRAALLLALALGFSSTPAEACGFCSPTYNNYIFKVGDYHSREAYSIGVDRDLLNAWNAYAHCSLTPDKVEELRTLSTDDLNRYGHPVIDYARNHGDKEMLLYLDCLARYLEAVNLGAGYNSWNYPSASDLATYNLKLRTVLGTIKVYKPVKYPERFRLLHMRVLYRLGDYAAADRLWKAHPIDKPANVFERMTCGFYAATLYARDRRDDAARLYALIGDAASARLCMNNRGSVSYMRSVADVDVNSSILPFMVENFINSLQETHDASIQAQEMDFDNDYMDYFFSCAGYDSPHTLYNTDFTRLLSHERLLSEPFTTHFAEYRTFAVLDNEIEAFMQFSATLLQRADLADPILWRTARAYIYYMRGQHDEAWAEINQPSPIPSPSEDVADCERTIRLLIATTLDDEDQMERTLSDLLPWLRKKMKAEEKARKRDYDYEDWSNIYPDLYFWQNVYYRILVHGLAQHYAAKGDATMQHLCYFLVSEDIHNNGASDDDILTRQPYIFYQDGYAGIFNDKFSDLSIDRQATIYHELFGKRSLTDFQTYLKNSAHLDANDFIDAIGTHCILEGHWEQALSWLKDIPLSYLSTQHVAYYAAPRSYKTELWFRHISVDYDPWGGHYDEETEEWVPNEYPTPVFKSNPKIDFCRDVMRLEKEVRKAKGEARCAKAYELATILAQASPHGDCWWLARYKTSVGTFAEPSAYEPAGAYNFGQEALRMADIALTTNDPALRSRAMMARFYMLDDTRTEWTYDEATDDWTEHTIVDPRYGKAKADLLNFLTTTQGYDTRISRCDVVVNLLRERH